MNRAHSLRQQRLPTASQMQSGGAPPPSNVRNGRIFGTTSLSQKFRRSPAGSFGPEMARKLTLLIKMEKGVLRSLEKSSRERKECAKQLSDWGLDGDDDISDISDKIGVLLYEICELENMFIDHYDQYRITLKAVRNIESSIQPSRDRKQKLLDQIYFLKHKDPDSPRLITLEQELVRAEAESLVAEAQLSNGTRQHFKRAFMIYFDALTEFSEKMSMISGYGHHLLGLIDDEPLTPGEMREQYNSYECSKQLILDCEQELLEWLPPNETENEQDEAIPAPEVFEQNNIDDMIGREQRIAHSNEPPRVVDDDDNLASETYEEVVINRSQIVQ